MNHNFDWNTFKEALAKKIPTEKFRAWIDPLSFIALTSENLVLSAPNEFAKTWVQDFFGPTIKNVLLEEYGLRLELHVERIESEDQIEADNSALLTAKQMLTEASQSLDMVDEVHTEPHEPIITHRTTQIDEDTTALNVRDLVAPALRTLAQPLNPKYNFQTYVVGTNNQFAHAAARAVAENPGRQYNPLFMYSHAGLGKTHLLHSIGNHVLNVNPKAKILYLNAELFVNDLIEAIRNNKQAQFRQKYREGYDVLLMDDIQFIANKQASQEEFFHTFNALHSSKKQIVVASDKFPKDIPGLEERIRSRFEWGLVVEIQSPDIETRIAILRSKAEQDDIFLPDDVAMFLATNVKQNVRELEGVLLRLGAKASLLGLEISLEMAKQELQHQVRDISETVDYVTVIETVAKHFSIKVSDLKGKDRSRRFALPRQITMYLLRKHCNKSYPDIGMLLGKKDHSTVLHGAKAITKALESDNELRKHIEEIQKQL